MVRCQLMLACLALAAISSAQARVFSSDGEQGHRARGLPAAANSAAAHAHETSVRIQGALAAEQPARGALGLRTGLGHV